MEKGLFFNALPDKNYETGYDRNYSADDISDWFRIVCDTGVLKGGLAVTNGTGLSVSVAQGKATILGKGYISDSAIDLALDTAPVGSNARYDAIVLRMDNNQTASGRKTYVYAKKGGSSVPDISALERTGDVYELMLAYVNVAPNATAIEQADITDTRGDENLCPWFTATKGYDDYYDAIVQQFESNVTLSASTKVVVTDLAGSLYNEKYSLIEVYVNGLKEENTEYSYAVDSGFVTITFTQLKNAGAQVSVVLSNFIDGEGLNTAIGDYNQWVNAVETLKEATAYTYVCNGKNDNVLISNLANEFINGGTDYGSMTIKVVGRFGCNNGTAYPVTMGGSGTSASPYYIFDIKSGNRRIILDFTDCGEANIRVSGVYVTIFNASNVIVKGLNLVANGTNGGTTIRAFNSQSGNVVCEDCRFWINGYQDSMVARTGTFTNCRASVSNATGNSYCFLNANLLRLNGGEYLAYTGSSSAKSAVIGQSASASVSILYGVSAPTLARSGYYQTNSIYQVGSGHYVNCTDLVSALPLSVVSGYSNIRGTIALSK